MFRYAQSLKTCRWHILLGILALALAQGCDSDTTTDNNAPADATQSDTSGGDLDGVDDLDSTQNPDGTSGEDTSGDASGGDTMSPDTTSDCHAYQTRCDGVCIPTSTDPDNCGGCGVVCGESEVCSGGTCTDSCMPGLQICDRQCVDFDSDSDHCGACGNACGDGMGCVNGTCEQAADLDPREQACAGGGPAIDLGDAVTVERQCTGELAERTFRWAVCSCEDLLSNSGMYADAYDSTLGPYTPGGEGGGVATNGAFRANSGFDTTGTLWAADELNSGAAVQTNMPGTISQRLHAGSAVQFANGVDIGGDAYVNGSVTRDVTIGGDLHVPDTAYVDDSVSYTNLQRGPVDVARPCDACGVDDRIPVGAIVANRSGSNNDNALIGLDEDILAGISDGTRRIDLPCGHYYLSEITTNQAVTIVATGNSALYIGGDINSSSPLHITVTPDAQLDIFVAGSVKTNTGLKLGSPNFPALLRMYVGGAGGFHANTGADLSGYIYAVPGGIKSTGGLEVFGGVFGQSIATNNGGTYHFDRRINVVGDSCPDRTPDPDPTDPEPDAGSDPDTTPEPDPNVCGTTSDACASNSDCCAPLICGSAGECVLMECQPAGASCTSDNDCCSGGCGSTGFCIVG